MITDHVDLQEAASYLYEQTDYHVELSYKSMQVTDQMIRRQQDKDEKGRLAQSIANGTGPASPSQENTAHIQYRRESHVIPIVFKKKAHAVCMGMNGGKSYAAGRLLMQSRPKDLRLLVVTSRVQQAYTRFR
jgi:hypothetical protein